MPYRIRYSEEARAAIRTLPGNYRQRIRRAIEDLATNARPARAKMLRDRPRRFCIALDRWRIVYDVDDDSEVILILRVRIKQGPETYERLVSTAFTFDRHFAQYGFYVLLSDE